MMYEKPEHAYRYLKRLFPEKRFYRDIGETISPGEEYLLMALSNQDVAVVKGSHPSRKTLRRLIGAARSLGLYPIPQWWIVRERLKESINRGASGFTRGTYVISETYVIKDAAQHDVKEV